MEERNTSENAYEPRPADLFAVELSEDLLALAEEIARNVHEVWSASRIAEGWTYGPRRDDVLKTTPCLVPYDELPEEEKRYDRDTALETLRLVTSLGYEIRKKTSGDTP